VIAATADVLVSYNSLPCWRPRAAGAKWIRDLDPFPCKNAPSRSVVENRSSMRLPPLNALRVCAAAAVILTFVASPASSQSNGSPQAACEKELARRLVTSLINNDLAKGGTILGTAYKGFKLSNSLEEEKVAGFLKEHGLTKPETIRKISGRVTHFVRGKMFHRGTVTAMVIGVAVALLDFLPPEYQPGSHANAKEAAKHDSGLVAPPLPTPPDPSDDFNRISSFEASLKQNFGEKSSLAALVLASPKLEECAGRTRQDLIRDPTDLGADRSVRSPLDDPIDPDAKLRICITLGHKPSLLVRRPPHSGHY